jgi:hypothetical protein
MLKTMQLLAHINGPKVNNSAIFKPLELLVQSAFRVVRRFVGIRTFRSTPPTDYENTQIVFNNLRFKQMALDSNPLHPLQVILGSPTIKAYVACPKEFMVIGIVRCEMEYGLLATTATGNYVRVNGSQVEALCNQTVEKAIHDAKLRGRGCSYSSERPAAVRAAPTVVLRKRRYAALAQ